MMRTSHRPLFATAVLLLIAAAGFAPAASASDNVTLTITPSFLGCDGTVATYRLTATSSPVCPGAGYEWSFNVTPTSSYYAHPNTGELSFGISYEGASVTLRHGLCYGTGFIFLPNPCLGDEEPLF